VTEDADPPPLPAERPPRKVRAPRKGPSLADRMRGKNASGKTRAKKKYPRVPISDFVSMFWGGMGALVVRVDAPVGRTVIMQADAAGDVLEDAVRDTAIDRGLQPIVRNYARGRKVAALVGPPVIVAAIEVAQRLPEEQMRIRMAILEPMLLSSLMLWDDVAAEKALERLERQESQRPKVEQAQRIAALIFADVPAAPEAEPANA
jgi:hypothetical protein